MKICYFGTYRLENARNKVLIKGLKENGVKIIECQVNFLGWKKYLQLVRDLIRKHKKIEDKYDIIIVGYPSEFIVPLAKIISKKPVVFDAFISRYNTERERKRFLRAGLYWFMDWLSCVLADLVLLDTDQHIRYFVSKYYLNKRKFRRIFVGTDDKIFKPCSLRRKSKSFKILFYAKVMPMHGFKYILEAAKILEKYPDIEFNIIGKGERYREIKKAYKNLKIVKFFKEVPYKKLPQFIKKVNVCLGIFGETTKARLVIPNKIFEAIAMKKPIISGKSKAMEEIFENRKDCLFCKMANAEDLAKKILELKNKSGLRNKIAQNSYKLFRENLTPKVLGKELKIILNNFKS